MYHSMLIQELITFEGFSMPRNDCFSVFQLEWARENFVGAPIRDSEVALN